MRHQIILCQDSNGRLDMLITDVSPYHVSAYELRAQIKVNRLEIFGSSESNLRRSWGKDWFFTKGAEEVDKEAVLQGSWHGAKAEANANKEAEKEADLGFMGVEKIESSSAQSF
ncbi:hypothetical protein QOT17_004014 [Balamuthia mandrillaris]